MARAAQQGSRWTFSGLRLTPAGCHSHERSPRSAPYGTSAPVPVPPPTHSHGWPVVHSSRKVQLFAVAFALERKNRLNPKETVRVSSLHETEIDGVRCFWADAHRPTLTARLVFRQGMADEVLSESGWLHLLEHLCLHGRGGGVLDVNGSVSILETQFDAHGPSGVAAQHLREVCAWLARPDLGGLDRERGVLRAEARLRQSALARALNWRYGAQGPGLVAYDEPGLVVATPELLAERAARVFTAENAVLALNGPPPVGLQLPLGRGEFLPPRPASPCEHGLGAYVDEAGLVMSGVVERSHAATWVPEIVQRALKQTLRDELGAAYSPSATYERVDSAHAVIVAGSDVLPDILPHLADRVLDLVGRMTSEPVPAQWIDQMRAARLQALADPDTAGGQAWRAASAALVGDPPEGLAELAEKTRSVDGEEIRHELTRFCNSLLLGLPGGSAWSDQLPTLRFPTSQQTASGAAFRSADWPANRSTLHIAADRIVISEPENLLEATIPELVGMYSFPMEDDTSSAATDGPSRSSRSAGRAAS